MKNNYQEKIKKIVFLITIIPYVVFLSLGIYNCINSSLENKYLDLYALIEPLEQFWFDIITDFNIFFICLIIFVVGYPIYYLLDKSNKKKNKEKDNIVQSKLSKSFLLYIISFIPYFFLIYSCIFGIDFGFFGNTSTYYGFEALFIAGIVGCVIPIYPIILIFQIIYTIKKYKTFTINKKRILKYIIFSIISLILIPSFINMIRENNKANTTFDNDKIVIEKYLIKEFGEQHYKNMEIVKNNGIISRYTIKTPLLDYGFSIELNEDRTNIIDSTFYEEFINDNNVTEMLNLHLADVYDLPNNIKVETSISNINLDIKNYDKSFDLKLLLEDCKYNIKSITIYTESLEMQDVTETIKDFYVNYSKILDEHHIGERVVFVLKTSEDNHFRVDILKPSKNENVLTIIFWSLNNEKIYVDLSGQ